MLRSTLRWLAGATAIITLSVVLAVIVIRLDNLMTVLLGIVGLVVAIVLTVGGSMFVAQWKGGTIKAGFDGVPATPWSESLAFRLGVALFVLAHLVTILLAYAIGRGAV